MSLPDNDMSSQSEPMPTFASTRPRMSLADARRTTRPVWFDGGWIDTPVYLREELPQAARFSGPAIIEQLDCTTVIQPGDQAEVDAIGNLVVSVFAAAESR